MFVFNFGLFCVAFSPGGWGRRQDPDDETDIGPDEIAELAREAGVYEMAVDLIRSDILPTARWRECCEIPACDSAQQTNACRRTVGVQLTRTSGHLVACPLLFDP